MRFTELLEEYGIPYVALGQHHHATRGWVNIDCPWCSANSNKFRLGYNLKGGFMTCWVCGRHKTVTTLVEITKDVKIGQRFREVAREEWDQSWIHKAKGVYKEPPGVGPLWPAHVDYLHDRGFRAAELIKLWSVQGLGADGGRLAWRVFIPVHFQGQLVSWTTRTISEEVKPKYKSAPPESEAIRHKDLLYGEDYCRNSVVVCEGPTDVWRIGPGAVCTFGTSWSNAQLERIAQYPLRAVVFDREDEAQRRADQLCDKLDLLPGKTYKVVLESKDPGSASPGEIAELRGRFLSFAV